MRTAQALGCAIFRSPGDQLLGIGQVARNNCRPVFSGDAVALVPRTNRENGLAREVGEMSMAGGLNDLAVGSHNVVMHYALRDCKRLLRNEARYPVHMSDPAERLRVARLRAGFENGKDAAEAMGIPVSTYLGHENGSRGYTAKRAALYARRFKVREQWLLYGVGEGPGQDSSHNAEVINIFDRLPPLKRAEALGYLRGLSEGSK